MKKKVGRPRKVQVTRPFIDEKPTPKPPPPSRCATCVHWKNKQALLNYSSSSGFCINDELSFNTTDGRMIGVIDKSNLRDRDKVTGNPSHDFETLGQMPHKVKISQYNLQTSEDFGCIFHEKE